MDEQTISRRTLLAVAAGAVGGSVLPAPNWPERELDEVFNVKAYGAKGDGMTDDTAAIQAAIDAGKGKTVLIPDGVFVHAGVRLSGSSYDGTTIMCYGELKLRARVASEVTYGGAFVGLIIKDCDNVTLFYRGHGNRTNQPNNEHCHLVGIAGATNFHAPMFQAREVRGDGLYVSQSDWLSESRVPSHIYLGQVLVTNSEDDGRNAISIISVDSMVIDSLISVRVGGAVGGAHMPGGLDIEPDSPYHTVNDVAVHSLHVITAGVTGFAVQGRAVTNDGAGDWNTSRVNIGDAVVRLTGPGGSVFLNRAFDLKANVTITASGPAKQALLIDNLDRPNVKAFIRGPSIRVGLNVGHDGWVSDFSIDVDVHGYTAHGLEACGVQRGKFVGRISGATSANSTFAIQTRSNHRAITQRHVIYSVDTPFDGSNARAFRNEPGDAVTFTMCRWQDSDVTGYASFPVTFENLTEGIAKASLAGVTEGTAAPSSGTWNVGDMVYNTTPGNGANAGWVCLATGAPGAWTRLGSTTFENSAKYDPPALAPGAGVKTTVSVQGAALGDYAEASFSQDLRGITLAAYVSSANTVSVRFQNGTSVTTDLAGGTLRVRVTKQ